MGGEDMKKDLGSSQESNKQSSTLEKFIVLRNMICDDMNVFFPHLTEKEKEFVDYEIYKQTFGQFDRAPKGVLVDPLVFQDFPEANPEEKAEESDSLGDNKYEKPKCSYAELIRNALISSPDGKLTLSEIYKWIKHSYPFFKKGDPVWQNSIRHNLSLNKSFKKLPRGSDSVGKGGYWAIDETFVPKKTVRARKKKEGGSEKSFGLERDNTTSEEVSNETLDFPENIPKIEYLPPNNQEVVRNVLHRQHTSVN